ncbi:MAG: CoA pyrophosphatase [Desulfuromonas sp.]|nr:MAG: CoA pyrophosphatase [Desulfuromonas sp.]
MPTLELIRKTFKSHRPEILDIEARRAAVAMILREQAGQVEMLMIRRAEHEGDPWSGDLGFPGGKVDFEDPSDRAAAERETFEEIDLQLGAEAFIGQIDDISGAYVPVNVACFVYLLDETATFSLNHEIDNYWWIPLSRFFEPERHRYVTFTYRNRHRARPVIDLVEPDYPFLWGITYRIIEQFFTLIGYPLPVSENPDE